MWRWRRAVVALVARHVAQAGEPAEPIHHARRPEAQALCVGIGHRVLVLRGGKPRADLDVLHRHRIGDAARHRVQPRLKPRDHLLRRGVGVDVVSRLLTHRNSTTTSQTYLHLNIEDLRAELNRCGAWARADP